MSRILEPGVARPPATVADVMSRDVATCSPDAMLAEAARIMWDRDCGFVPVTDAASGTLRGVVTDRDACMASLTQGRALRDLPVRTAMARSVVTASPEDSLVRAHVLMRERRVRRLPVVDSRGRVVGVLSLNDIARHAREAEAVAERRDVAATLAEVCRHRELVTA
jgi:CBS domain-containing protein